jgi:hypothetical protein
MVTISAPKLPPAVPGRFCRLIDRSFVPSAACALSLRIRGEVHAYAELARTDGRSRDTAGEPSAESHPKRRAKRSSSSRDVLVAGHENLHGPRTIFTSLHSTSTLQHCTKVRRERIDRAREHKDPAAHKKSAHPSLSSVPPSSRRLELRLSRSVRRALHVAINGCFAPARRLLAPSGSCAACAAPRQALPIRTHTRSIR